MSCQEEKKRLRSLIKSRVAAMSPEERRGESEAALRLLAEDPHYKAARVVLLYHSLPDEPCTHAFIQDAAWSKTMLLPVVREDGLMEARRYAGADFLSEGAFGIQEPQGGSFADLEKIDLAVVPGRAFSLSGVRLGRGAGYYDRFLSLAPLASVYKVGLCFSCQIVAELPTEAHDLPMNKVIAPVKVFL